ncbi:MAG TPA: VTC domain-containing protein [Verrucomicrobiae bacterium]
MNASLPNARYERKFTLPGVPLEQALILVRRHPAAFREAYPERTVNNLYLDSPALSDYHDHVNGAPNRLKTRVRWYGDRNGSILNPMLERKLKRGLLSGKVTHPLPSFILNGDGAAAVLEAAFTCARLPDLLGRAYVPAAFPLQPLPPPLFCQRRRPFSPYGRLRIALRVSAIKPENLPSPFGFAVGHRGQIHTTVRRIRFLSNKLFSLSSRPLLKVRPGDRKYRRLLALSGTTALGSPASQSKPSSLRFPLALSRPKV